MFSEKTTKFCEISTNYLTSSIVRTFWETLMICSSCVCFSKSPNYTASQIIGGDFAKFCGFLRIYELKKLPLALGPLLNLAWMSALVVALNWALASWYWSLAALYPALKVSNRPLKSALFCPLLALEAWKLFAATYVVWSSEVSPFKLWKWEMVKVS